jgi:hypothetical protein
VKTLYKYSACGRLSSGYRRGFQNLYNSFPTEGYPLPNQALFKTSTNLFPAEGYPLPNQALSNTSTNSKKSKKSKNPKTSKIPKKSDLDFFPGVEFKLDPSHLKECSREK